MSLWIKLNTLFKATAHEPLEQLVEANSWRIFQQEIRDAENAIVQAKQHLATVMAQHKQLARHNDLLQQSINTREQQAVAALDKDEQQLAQELAALIADDENLLREQQQQQAHLQSQQVKLKRQLRIALQSTQKYQRELDLARANSGAQKALGQLQGHSNGLSVSLEDMASSLDRIKAQQTKVMDHDQALLEIDAELTGKQLDQQLKQAGIACAEHDANAVLQRLRLSL